jgi:hypothetical protein
VADSNDSNAFFPKGYEFLGGHKAFLGPSLQPAHSTSGLPLFWSPPDDGDAFHQQAID